MPTQPKLTHLPEFKGSGALYRPLDSQRNEIRILTIWPNEDRLAPLECSLRVESLDDRPRYHALSYYWGPVNAENLDMVLVSGSDEGSPTPSFQVPVTVNLTSALRKLRSQTKSAKVPLRTWTDALCINQRNAEERSKQVRLMKRIFESSCAVLAWLGEGNVVVERGLAGLAQLGNFWGIEGLRLLPHDDDNNDSSSDGPVEEVPCWTSDEFLKGVEALLDLQYWHRAWVIQEARANAQVYLVYGHTTCRVVHWESLHSLCLKLASEMIKGSPKMFDAHLYSRTCLAFAHFQRSASSEVDFILLLATRSWLCTDPRDFVFALGSFCP